MYQSVVGVINTCIVNFLCKRYVKKEAEGQQEECICSDKNKCAKKTV